MASPTSSARQTPHYKDHYGSLLVLLAALFVLASLGGGALRPLELGLLGVLLVITQRTSGAPPALSVVTGVLVAAVVAASFVALGRSADRVADLVHDGASALLCFATIITILSTLVRRAEAVSIHTVAGVLAAYLLIGFGFASSYSFVGNLSSAPFSHGYAAHTPSVGEYLYFSFITLTTTGYGDLSPALPAGKVLAVGESVTGQLYLVTVVAIAVTALVGSRERNRKPAKRRPGKPTK